ncbi:GHKL domain-containing protein [Brevibacterium sp. JNUCC-42]|nr:GHKL domain-containing protein [Brevibacterium sp. JNUCC-42]
MKNKGLASRIAILIFSSLLFFLFFVATAYVSISELRNNKENEVQKHNQTLEEINELQDQYEQVVLLFRGYIAFGVQGLAEKTNKSRSKFTRQLGELQATIANSQQNNAASKQKTISEIEASWKEYDAWVRESMVLKRDNRTKDIEELSKSIGKNALNKMENKLSTLYGYYKIDLDGALAQKAMYSKWVYAVPGVILVGLSITGLFLVRFLRRDVVIPLEQIDQTVKQISAGEFVYLPESTRWDELRTLVRGINLMTTKLEQRQRELEESNIELVTKRDMLETQNEEILAQQAKQEEMLLKLTIREQELEYITSYQEKLTSFSEFDCFLEHSISSLMRVLNQDAAMVVIKEEGSDNTGRVVYATGYSMNQKKQKIQVPELAIQAMNERQPLSRKRVILAEEQALHNDYLEALDQYYPLQDDKQHVFGFILMTCYHQIVLQVHKERLTRGLVKQLSLAMYTQMINEESRQQAEELARLNDKLRKEQHHIEEQRDFIQRILDANHEGMLLCDYMGRILYANPRMTQYFPDIPFVGLTMDEVWNVIEPQAKDQKLASLDQLIMYIQGKKTSLQQRFTYKNEQDKTIHYELYATHVSSDEEEKVGHLFVLRDRTAEEKVDEMKTEFLSVVSHELRTPLSTVLGFMEILLHRTLPIEKQKKYLETTYKEGKRLSNLLNDFLDLQRMQAGKQNYHFTHVQLGELLQELLEQWQVGQNHHIVLTKPEQNIYVKADTDQLTQVIHNLLSNAIKYSPGAEKIDVRVQLGKSHVQITVQDYGLGIPKDTGDQLFQKFYRVDNSDRRQIGGTGLGLAIVKEIVERHQGTITYASELGKGSTFIVTLPIIDSSIGNEHQITEVSSSNEKESEWM